MSFLLDLTAIVTIFAFWSGNAMSATIQSIDPYELEPIVDPDNNSNNNGSIRAWLHIENIPKLVETVSYHGDLTLQCEVSGYPPPVIFWLKNGKRIEHELKPLSPGPRYDQQNFTMSQVVSKLFLRCVTFEDEGQYKCVAHNDEMHLEATTVVSISDDDPTTARPRCKRILKYFELHKNPKHPVSRTSILTAESVHLEPMGNDVTLPCQISGVAKAKISWLDKEGNDIISNKKFQMFPSGSLLIRNLAWDEMGEYTCKVKTRFWSEIAVTFLYPLMPK